MEKRVSLSEKPNAMKNRLIVLVSNTYLFRGQNSTEAEHQDVVLTRILTRTIAHLYERDGGTHHSLGAAHWSAVLQTGQAREKTSCQVTCAAPGSSG